MRCRSIICGVALATTVAHALPDVTPVSLGADCKNFPGWNSDTGEAGPWPLFASSTEQFVAEFSGSTLGDAATGEKARARINIAVNPMLAKQVIKCGSLPNVSFPDWRVGLVAYEGPNPDTGVLEWSPVTLGPGNRAAFILVDQAPGGSARQLQAHSHFYPNGTQQPGVFLGWQNVTTWAYKREVSSQGIDQYRLRLLIIPNSLERDEFRGFVRVGSL